MFLNDGFLPVYALDWDGSLIWWLCLPAFLLGVKQGLPGWPRGWDSALPARRAWVPSLVRELQN